MTKFSSLAALSSAMTCVACAAMAQSTTVDSFYQEQIIEFNAGLFAPINTLQDTLTTPNGGGDEVQSTDALNLGLGPRIDIGYSRPWGNDTRLVISLTGAGASGDTDVVVGTATETFPGTYDDGFLLPADWTAETEIETQTAMLMIGHEWTLDKAWRLSAGLQAGQASQDLAFTIFDTTGVSVRDVQASSNNEMYGVFGGVSYYYALSSIMGVHVSGNIGVMKNTFTYDYANVVSSGFISQEISDSRDSTAISAQVAARLDRLMTDNGMLSFEIGYEGISGIGNAVDTFLDEDGTATEAHIDNDMIGGVYISAGYAYRF